MTTNNQVAHLTSGGLLARNTIWNLLDGRKTIREIFDAAKSSNDTLTEKEVQCSHLGFPCGNVQVRLVFISILASRLPRATQR